jgi:hypothetical protein
MGKLPEALDMQKRSLAMKEQLHGVGVPHPDVAASLNNLASVLKAMGKLPEALDMQKRAFVYVAHSVYVTSSTTDPS